jgi:hypothetical protein
MLRWTDDASTFFGCRPWCKNFLAYVRVIDCGLLSGLDVRRFQKPRAGMVISGSTPNLSKELMCSQVLTGFPDPDLFDHCAHSGHSSLTLPLASTLAGQDTLLMPQPAPDL